MVRHADLSTGHITTVDNTLPGNAAALAAPCLTIAPYAHGYFIGMPHSADFLPRLQAAGLSAAFIDLIHLCQTQKIDVLCLDGEPDFIDFLPIFEW